MDVRACCAVSVLLAGVLRPFGLSYELAFPLLVILDRVIIMIRIMLNVAAASQP